MITPADVVGFWCPAGQARCVTLCKARGAKSNIYYARIHHDVIARFGRFPYRNPALRRQTKPEEQAFLEGDGLSA